MAKLNIGKLIAVFLMAVVGLAFTPTIQEMVTGSTGVANATWPGNLSGASSDIMTLFPLFWTILMIAIPVAYVTLQLRAT
ncbi:MAG: hypothetical protein ACYS76_04560 [Planctomycetota bacterium]|jgi:hypothetical protein